MRGVVTEFGSLEETFMIKLLNIEREAKLYEVMLLALSALGAEPKKIQELLDEYIYVLYPESDKNNDSFIKRAQEKLTRHVGKPFTLDMAPGEGLSLRPEIDSR
jgi:hypothetical protein